MRDRRLSPNISSACSALVSHGMLLAIQRRSGEAWPASRKSVVLSRSRREGWYSGNRLRLWGPRERGLMSQSHVSHVILFRIEPMGCEIMLLTINASPRDQIKSDIAISMEAYKEGSFPPFGKADTSFTRRLLSKIFSIQIDAEKPAAPQRQTH